MTKPQNLTFLIIFIILFFPSAFGQGRYSEAKNNYVGESALRWINPVRGIPDGAVVGDMRNGKPIFVARGFYKGRYYPGRTTKNMMACIIGYKGREVRVVDFQILAFVSGKGEYETVSDKVERKMLGKIYEISDVLKTDKYMIFLSAEMLKTIKPKFIELRKLAIQKKDKLLARKIDKIVDGLKGAFVKLEDVKKDVHRLEKMF